MEALTACRLFSTLRGLPARSFLLCTSVPASVLTPDPSVSYKDEIIARYDDGHRGPKS